LASKKKLVIRALGINKKGEIAMESLMLIMLSECPSPPQLNQGEIYVRLNRVGRIPGPKRMTERSQKTLFRPLRAPPVGGGGRAHEESLIK
jgi:hypothetical protein